MSHIFSTLGFSVALVGLPAILIPARLQDVQPPSTSSVCSYMPLAIGNSWTYSVRGAAGENKSVWFGYERQITDTVRDSNGSLLYAFKNYYNGSHRPGPIDGYYACTDGAIYWSFAVYDSQWTRKPAPEVPILRSPLVVGNAWRFVYNDTTITNYTIASIGPLKFNGTHIDSVVLVVAVSNWGTDSSWYCRGIGLLKRRRESRLKDASHCLTGTTVLGKYHVQ